MTQPPEYRPDRTETQRLGDDIAHQASLIRRSWDEVLQATAPARRPGFGGARSATITLDDDDTSTADLDAHTRLMHLRRNATDVLNQWCRLVMEERPVDNPKSLPLGQDVPGMCAFLERQADWLSGTDHAPYALEELTEIRWQVQAYTDPYKREWHRIGYCPFVVDGKFCGGTVRLKIGSGEDEATCTGCDQAGPVQWWEEAMNVDVGTEPVRATRLAQIISTRLHVNVDERTIRRWAKAGKLTPNSVDTGDDGKPAYWFDPRFAIDEVARMDRECPTCGRLWSGIGEVCGRCYATINHGQPRYAERDDRASPKRGIVIRAEQRPAPRDVSETDVCGWSDLPTAWCACGRHAS